MAQERKPQSSWGYNQKLFYSPPTTSTASKFLYSFWEQTLPTRAYTIHPGRQNTALQATTSSERVNHTLRELVMLSASKLMNSGYASRLVNDLPRCPDGEPIIFYTDFWNLRELKTLTAKTFLLNSIHLLISLPKVVVPMPEMMLLVIVFHIWNRLISFTFWFHLMPICENIFELFIYLQILLTNLNYSIV